MNQTMESDSINWQPKRWVALLLSFFAAPMAMLYLGRKYWALFYFLLLIGLVYIRFTVFSDYGYDDLWYIRLIFPLIVGVHSFLLVPTINEPRKWYSRWYGLLSVFLLFFIPFFIYRTFYQELFTLPSSSMLPTYKENQHFTVDKWGCGNYQFMGLKLYQTAPSPKCEVKRGDIIVFEFPPHPEELYIKRVVAVGGDHIEYNNKTISINGQAIRSKLIRTEDKLDYYEETLGQTTYQVVITQVRNNFFRFTSMDVPEGYLFVMGDNRDNSSDSRVWGLVPIENLVGIVKQEP